MDADAAETFLANYALFWTIRGRWHELAFGLQHREGVAEYFKGPSGEDLVALKPEAARRLWAVAMADAIQIALAKNVAPLTIETAAHLSKMSAKQRLVHVDAAVRALGLTAAGRKKYVPYTEFEDDALWSRGIWRWVAERGIADPPGASPR